MNSKSILAVSLILSLALAAAAYAFWPRFQPPPDFSQYPAGAERKQQFFAFMLPLVESENAALLEQRAWLQQLAEADYELGWLQRWRLQRLAPEYKLQLEGNSSKIVIDELLLRVNTIPTSLALAQAAKESGWGTSRFAREGNNFFGQWCFKVGCGLVPRQRNSGSSHEVAKFANARISVRSYLQNLNRHYRYEQLRQARAQAIAQGSAASGSELAAFLGAYSEQGNDYIESLQQIIRINDLENISL